MEPNENNNVWEVNPSANDIILQTANTYVDRDILIPGMGAVRYDQKQTLSAAEQRQARQNIGVDSIASGQEELNISTINTGLRVPTTFMTGQNLNILQWCTAELLIQHYNDSTQPMYTFTDMVTAYLADQTVKLTIKTLKPGATIDTIDPENPATALQGQNVMWMTRFVNATEASPVPMIIFDFINNSSDLSVASGGTFILGLSLVQILDAKLRANGYPNRITSFAQLRSDDDLMPFALEHGVFTAQEAEFIEILLNQVIANPDLASALDTSLIKLTATYIFAFDPDADANADTVDPNMVQIPTVNKVKSMLAEGLATQTPDHTIQVINASTFSQDLLPDDQSVITFVI